MAKDSFGKHENLGGMEFVVEGKHHVMPFTLSVEGPDDTPYCLIPKGARLPKKYSQVFTNNESFQMSFYFHLVIGERALASANTSLCVIRFDQGSFHSAGRARYRLDVEMTREGRLCVNAYNLDIKAAGRVLYDSNIVSAQTVAALQEDAERHRDHDAMIENRFNFMRSVRSEVNDLHDEKWPMAKRKMTFSEKSAYRKCRKRIYKLIEPGPEMISENDLDELLQIFDGELKELRELMERRADEAARRFDG